jgi:DNA-directed RNA polymerase specialized sigma24 family protein
MPFKTDKLKLGLKVLKRSSRLLDCQKERILAMYGEGVSITQLGKIFHCNKRTIQFLLFPERLKKNIELRKERGGSKIYYIKEKHTKAIREHRQYKYKTLK